MRFTETPRLVSQQVSLFDLEQVESVTNLVNLKVSFRSHNWLDESKVNIWVFIFT